MQRGIRDVAVTLASRGVTVVTAVALQCALARLLGTDGRGQYAVCLTFATLLAILFAFGLDFAASHFLSTKRMSINEAISFCWAVLLIIAAVGLPIAYALTLAPIEFMQKAPREAFLLSCFWMVTSTAFMFSVAQLTGSKAFPTLAGIVVLRSALVLIGAVLCVAYLNMGVLGPIAADMFAASVASLATWLWFRLQVGYRWVLPTWGTIAAALHYGARTYPGTLGMQTNARIGTILLAFYVSESEIGLFAVAFGFLAQMITLSDVIGATIRPRIAETPARGAALAILCCRMISTLTIILCTTILFFAEPIIGILFSRAFIPAVTLLWILAPGILFRNVSKMLFPYFNGIDRPGVVSNATIITLAVNALLLLLLLPSYALIGAAYAVTGAYIMSALYVFYVFGALTGISVFQLFFVSRADCLMLTAELKQTVKRLRNPDV